MTEDEFVEIARGAARRATNESRCIGKLVLTQTGDSYLHPNVTAPPKLREPEICTAFQQEAEARDLFYGVEVPTLYPHNISGKTDEAGIKSDGRHALIDFAILEEGKARSKRNVLLEFKEGQPSSTSVDGELSGYKTIRKDLHKLWADPMRHGWCIFHVLQTEKENEKENEGTLPVLIRKYNEATNQAIKLAKDTYEKFHDLERQDAKVWSLLLILVITKHAKGSKEPESACLYRAHWDGNAWNYVVDSVSSNVL